MSDTNPATPSLTKVRAALAEHGEIAAGTLAERAGLAYPTTTAQLRLLEKDGHAERFRAEDRRTLWRLTDAGRAAVHTTDDQIEQPSTPDAAPDRNAATPTATSVVSGPGDDASGDEHSALDDQAAAAKEGEAQTPTDREAAGQPVPDPAVTADRGARAEHRTGTDDHDDASDTPPADEDAPAPAARRRSRTRRVKDTPAVASGTTPPAKPHNGGADTEGGERRVRRAHGALRSAVVAILENNPDTQYKVGQLCKLINEAQADTGMPKASPGAVVNDLDKLVTAGIAVQTMDRPATFQLATGVRD